MATNENPVQLQVKDFENREVMKVDYKFNQATDIEGQLSGNPRGGLINVRVKALNDDNNQLLQWMLEPATPRDISIVFLNTVDGSTMKEIKGENCYCVHYEDCWEDGQIHFEEITIVCQVLKNGSVEFNNAWK